MNIYRKIGKMRNDAVENWALLPRAVLAAEEKQRELEKFPDGSRKSRKRSLQFKEKADIIN